MNNLPVDARRGSVLHGTRMKKRLINHIMKNVLLSIKVRSFKWRSLFRTNMLLPSSGWKTLYKIRNDCNTEFELFSLHDKAPYFMSIFPYRVTTQGSPISRNWTSLFWAMDDKSWHTCPEWHNKGICLTLKHI